MASITSRVKKKMSNSCSRVSNIQIYITSWRHGPDSKYVLHDMNTSKIRTSQNPSWTGIAEDEGEGGVRHFFVLVPDADGPDITRGPASRFTSSSSSSSSSNLFLFIARIRKHSLKDLISHGVWMAGKHLRLRIYAPLSPHWGKHVSMFIWQGNRPYYLLTY